MVDNFDWTIVCTDCGSSGSDIFIDVQIGELVCKDCGLVLQNFVWFKDEIYET